MSFSSVDNVFNDTITGPVECHYNNFNSCVFAHTKECNSMGLLYLRCSKNYWSGIHYTVHASPSILSHAVLKHTGYTNTKSSHAALEIDFNQHILHNINISDCANHDEAIGILIRKQSVLNAENISDIHVEKYRGPGLVSHDSRLIIKNSTFKNIGESYDPGLLIHSSMTHIKTFNFSYIKPMCSVANYTLSESTNVLVRVYDLVLSQWQKCEVVLTAAIGYSVSIQVIAGEVGTDRSCGERTLLFYDLKNGDEDQGEGVKANRDGYTWFSSTNLAKVIMQREYDITKPCMDIIVSIQQFKQEFKPLKQLILKDTHVEHFKDGLHLNYIQNSIDIGGYLSTGARNHGIHAAKLSLSNEYHAQ